MPCEPRLKSKKKTYISKIFKDPYTIGKKMSAEGSMPDSVQATSDPVLISVERLRELEAIEASIPNLIAQAILDHKKNNLKKLHEKDKLHPENVNLRVKRYAERHKDELNQRRREKRKQKKIEMEAAKAKELENVEQPVVSSEPVIVRFDDEPQPKIEKPKIITVRVVRKQEVLLPVA